MKPVTPEQTLNYSPESSLSAGLYSISSLYLHYVTPSSPYSRPISLIPSTGLSVTSLYLSSPSFSSTSREIIDYLSMLGIEHCTLIGTYAIPILLSDNTLIQKVYGGSMLPRYPFLGDIGLGISDKKDVNALSNEINKTAPANKSHPKQSYGGLPLPNSTTRQKGVSNSGNDFVYPFTFFANPSSSSSSSAGQQNIPTVSYGYDIRRIIHGFIYPLPRVYAQTPVLYTASGMGRDKAEGKQSFYSSNENDEEDDEYSFGFKSNGSEEKGVW
jgi:hypothetical protein